MMYVLTRNEFSVILPNVLTDRGQKNPAQDGVQYLRMEKSEDTAHEEVCTGHPLLRDIFYGRRLINVDIDTKPTETKQATFHLWAHQGDKASLQ